MSLLDTAKELALKAPVMGHAKAELDTATQKRDAAETELENQVDALAEAAVSLAQQLRDADTARMAELAAAEEQYKAHLDELDNKLADIDDRETKLSDRETLVTEREASFTAREAAVAAREHEIHVHELQGT